MHPDHPDRNSFLGAEFALWFWVASLLWEEIMQYREESDMYFHRISNQMDTLIMFLLVSHIIVTICARVLDSSVSFDICIYLLIVATIFAYLRLLNVFAFSQTLGPLFFVIMRLIKDVAKWVFIFVIFMVSFQLAIMALTSEAGENQWNPYPTGTFAVAFFTIIGDYSYAMETMNKSYLGVALLAIYALISQIMLVNLLIAMMGNTYTEVKENSDKEWQFYRYVIVYEYKASSAYPPPFNFIVAPFVLLSKRLKEQKTAGYFMELSSQHSYHDPAPEELSESEQNTMKKLKISREKILEHDEKIESVSLKNLSDTVKEQLRLMSSQRDSDRKYYEQQLKKALEEYHEKHLIQRADDRKYYEQQLKVLEDHHEKRFTEIVELLNEMKQLSKISEKEKQKQEGEE